MKKLLAILMVICFLMQTSFAVSEAVYKATFEESSFAQAIKQKGILNFGEDALFFQYSDGSFSIPYEDIQALQYSERKKSLNPGLLAGLVPVSITNAKPPTDYGTFDSEFPVGTAIAIAITLLIVLATAQTKYIYFDVIFDSNDEIQWMLFKIKRKDSQSILVKLATKSGVEVEEITK